MTRRVRDERGAFLLLWAMLLLGVLAMVAIVIDLGRVRDTRRQAQRTADLAAVSAGLLMANGDVIGACQAAVNYVKSNEDFSTLGETCAAEFAGPCVATVPRRMTTTVGGFTVTIQSPVVDAEIEEAAYPPHPVTGNLVLEEDGAPCERMRVSIAQENPALFAGVVGVNSLTARATAVIRGFIGTAPTENAGLVVLERRGCEALRASGLLASVLVKGSFAADGTPRPGVIQVDTRALPGSGTLCSTAGGNIPAKYAVFGNQLNNAHPTRPNQPSIEAQAIGGVPGRINMYALTENAATIHAAYDVPLGVKPRPTPGVIASRNVVDKVYNAPGPGGTPGEVSKLKTSSSSLVSSLVTAAAAAPCLGTCNALVGDDGVNYAVYPPGTPGGNDVNGVPPLATTSGTALCASNDATEIKIPASYGNVFVNCNVLDVVQVRFLGGRVVLKGELRIGSNRVAAFPHASEVVVGGCGPCTGGSAAAINASGVLLVNSGGDDTAPLAPTCSDGNDNDNDFRTDYDPDPAIGDSGCLSAADWDETSCLEDRAAPVGASRLVVNTGPIRTSSSSVVQLCQTFVLMADGASLPHQDVSAATDPTCAGDVDINGVLIPQPCPINNAYKGFLELFGTIDWVAPNQNPGERDTSQPNQRFEDLAFWTETSTLSDIKGAGNSVTGGVYFLPNATFNFSGQASQLIDLNAQFLARRLLLSGQGTLSMKPNPEDTVDTPAPYFALIR